MQQLDEFLSHPPLPENDQWGQDYVDSAIPLPPAPPKRKRSKTVTTRSNEPTDASSPSTRQRKLQLEESSDSEKTPSPKRQATGQKLEAELRAEHLAVAQARFDAIKAETERERKAKEAAKTTETALKVSGPKPPCRARTQFNYGPPFMVPQYIPSFPQSGATRPIPSITPSSSAAAVSQTATTTAHDASTASEPAVQTEPSPTDSGSQPNTLLGSVTQSLATPRRHAQCLSTEHPGNLSSHSITSSMSD